MAQKRKTTGAARKSSKTKRSSTPSAAKTRSPRRPASTAVPKAAVRKAAAPKAAAPKAAAPKAAAPKAAARDSARPAGPAAASSAARNAPQRKARKRRAPAEQRRARAGRASNDGDNGANGTAVGKSLVIVESPAKARTIGKYLGPDYRVRATVGHVRDLPPKGLGIDVDKGFAPRYVPVQGKEKTLAELKSAAKDASHIYLATDPDREGEAIAWHVAESIKQRGLAPIQRVLFHEITRDAVQRAIRNAGDIDQKKVEAQQARRVLDRLVGYKTSPLLWKTIKKGLSAGRVQTVALRLIVEREREVRAFKPVEYWTVQAQLEKAKQSFTARLHQIDGRKPEIHNETEANAILSDLEGRKTFQVTDVRRRERRKNSSAPFTTSTLQQEGAKRLGFGSKKTMKVAQGLYEGIDLGTEGAVGLITYMRTDSTRVADSAAQQAQDYITTLFGKQFLANGLQLYGGGKNKANTQDAHEAIRPTDPTRRPEHIRKYLSADQYKLYELVWKRFMASQMAPAVFDTTTVDFDLGRYLFRATGSVVKFEGFLVLYREAHEEGDGKALEDEQALPVLDKSEHVPVKEIVPRQHFTEPPPRFSEASLVKELERLGIGRPSTYASIISTLADRRYVNLEQRRFTPTELGETVEKIMVRQFPDIFNVTFTSTMEQDLDRVEEGEATGRQVLEEFYTPFSTALGKVDVRELIAQAHDLSVLETERCPDCGSKLQAHGGIFGPYLACERRPDCKFTRRLGAHRKPAIPTDEKCHECGAPMVIRHGRTGEFLGCSKFPKCRGTRALPTGIKCPKDAGDIIQLRSKKGGRAFYGCANHPNCDFVCWNRPVKEVCPECGFEGAEARSTKARGEFRRCLKCANEWDVPAPVAAVAV